MRRAASLLAASVAALAPSVAAAYCPSYTPAQTAGGQNCGVEPAPGKNPDVATWTTIFQTVSGGKASWGTNGPDIGTLQAGCGKPSPKTQVPAVFPCYVLKAITMQESGWRQFCVPDAPSGSVGAKERTIVSFDCGYGIGQVTSGMHVGETPSFDRARVASDPMYNLATGTRILRDKWAFTKCVGDADPKTIEDWYTAIWAYNGLSYKNNPNNPNLTPGRGPYNPKNGGSYAYQEYVYGWMEYPPSASHWVSLPAAYPNRGDLGTSGAPGEIPEPACASPTSCAGARPVHAWACDGPAVVDAGSDAAGDAEVPRPVVDAAPVSDAASVPDAAPPAEASGGCGCTTPGRRGEGAWGGLALAALAVAARRRTRGPAGAATRGGGTDGLRVTSRRR